MTLVKNLHDLAALISQAEAPETGTEFNARLKAALGQDEHLGKQAAAGLAEAPTSTEPQVSFSDITKVVTITLGDSEVAAHILPERSQAAVGNLWAAQKGVGIGTRLMLALCDWCKDHGIKFITGSDVSPNGESAKIRQKLPGKSMLFRRKWDNDLNTPNGVDIWPDAPDAMKDVLRSVTPDPQGHIMVTKLAAALRASLAPKTAATFTIPPKLAPHVQATGGLTEARTWHTKVWLGNSGTRDHTEVTAIAFDPKTTTVVPIAASDEHQNGWELVQWLQNKGIIPKLPYKILFLSVNFADAADAEALQTFKEWLALGGPNTAVRSRYDRPGFMVSMKDYVAAQGQPGANYDAGVLAPVGARLIKSLDDLSAVFTRIHSGQRTSEKILFRAAQACMDAFDHARYAYTLSYAKIQEAEQALGELGAGGDSAPFERAIFAFDGLKNQMHNALRTAGNNQFSDAELRNLFGDIALAKQEFDRMGAAPKSASNYVEVWPSAWIDPAGEVHECESHEDFAGKLVGPEDRHYPQAGLLRRGWIRIGEYEDDCYAECYHWTTKALALTQAAFQNHPKFRGETITVDTGLPGSAVEIPYEDFMALNKPTEFRRWKFAAEGEHGPDLGENGVATDQTGQFWGSAGAGLLFVAEDTGRVLFAHRSEHVNEPGTWGVWGGAIDAHEDPQAAALREAKEEANYQGQIRLKKLFVYRSDGFTYTTFLGFVPSEFEPRLNWESDGHRWAEPGAWPEPLHFGIKALLPQLNAATEHAGVEHLESAGKKTASEDQTMAGYYDVVAQVVRDGADTFEKFMTGLKSALGPNFPQFLEDASGNVGLRNLWTSVIEHDADDLENSLEHMRISPRKPTGVRSTEDPHGDERLQPGLEAMSRDEQALAHNVAIMQTYPGFSHLQGNPRSKAEQIVNILKDNLIWLYNEWDQTLRDRSKLWYVGGNRVIHRWARRFKMQPHQIAAVIAALSPQQDWFTNVTLAERLLSAIKEHADTPWDDAMTQATLRLDSKGEPGWGSKVMKALGMSPEEAGKLMVGKTLRDIMGTDNESLYKQAIWIRAWDEGHNPNGHRTLSPEGEFGDWDRKVNGDPIKNRWNSFGEITKAIKLAEAPDARLISDVVGENHKVRSFYNNLVAPMSSGGDVTIDTHAVAAALLRPLSAAHREVNHNFGMGLKGDIAPTSSKITGSTGLYGFYAEAYRRAGAAVGVQPREMQSITWEAVRGLFKPHQKRMDAITQGTDQAWHDVSGGKHGPDAARQRILELVGGLDRPSWSKPHPGDPAGERDSSYTGELPEAGASGRGRALPGGAGAGGARGVAAGMVASRGVTATNIQARLDRLASLLLIPRVS